MKSSNEVHTPERAADPLAWYINQLERSMDHYRPYNILPVFKAAGLGAIPINLLGAYQDIEEAADALQEATESLIGKLEALVKARPGQAGAGGSGHGDSRTVADVVRAKRIELVDDAGRIRCEFRVFDEDNVGLQLFDADGKRRVLLNAADGEATLQFSGSKDKADMTLGLRTWTNWDPGQPDQTLPHLDMQAPNGSGAFGVFQRPDGRIEITGNGKGLWTVRDGVLELDKEQRAL